MFDYAGVASIVDTQLRFFGQEVTLKYKRSGDYNPATGTVTVTETIQAAAGIVFDYGNKNIDGTLIKAGDKQLYLSPSGITAPEVNDTAVVEGVTYTIAMVKSLSPSGTPTLYECTIRR